MKVFVLLLIFVLSGALAVEEEVEELQCNIKVCGIGLLTFKEVTFPALIKKMQTAIFCLKECSPPAVREFFHSLSYALTKRIPGQCAGEKCIDENRFIALAHCVEEYSWPLIHCSKRLIDLAQLALKPIEKKLHVNQTCRIVIETTQCLEETLQKCGARTFSLVQEIFNEVVQRGIKFYCHPVLRSVDITESPLDANATEVTKVYIRHAPVAKGLKSRKNGAPESFISLFTVLGSVLGVVYFSFYK